MRVTEKGHEKQKTGGGKRERRKAVSSTDEVTSTMMGSALRMPLVPSIHFVRFYNFPYIRQPANQLLVVNGAKSTCVMALVKPNSVKTAVFLAEHRRAPFTSRGEGGEGGSEAATGFSSDQTVHCSGSVYRQLITRVHTVMAGAIRAQLDNVGI